MIWAKQAPVLIVRTARAGRGAQFVCLFAVLGVLGGCSMSSKGVADIDAGLTTASAPAPTPTPSATPEDMSDQATVRNAVTSVDLAQGPGRALNWANGGTGSRGEISGIVESKQDGVKCRAFTTTMENFSGVSLYHGKACMVAPGAWQMTAFAPN